MLAELWGLVKGIITIGIVIFVVHEVVEQYPQESRRAFIKIEQAVKDFLNDEPVQPPGQQRPAPKENPPREAQSVGQTEIISCRMADNAFASLFVGSGGPNPWTLELNLTKKQITGMQIPDWKDMEKINPIPLRISSQTIEWKLPGHDQTFWLERDSLDLYIGESIEVAFKAYNCRPRRI
jgi:hypothetical protein